MQRRHVAVVGAGVMGAAAARALAGRGRDVTLPERFDVGRGARLKEGVAVRSLAPDAEGVTIHTDQGAVRADVVLVTAGAWARDLLAGAGIDLPTRPTRETVAYFAISGAGPAIPTLV